LHRNYRVDPALFITVRMTASTINAIRRDAIT
jgi:hypothetical protein